MTEWFRELKDKHQLDSIGSMTASQVRGPEFGSVDLGGEWGV